MQEFSDTNRNLQRGLQREGRYSFSVSDTKSITISAEVVKGVGGILTIYRDIYPKIFSCRPQRARMIDGKYSVEIPAWAQEEKITQFLDTLDAIFEQKDLQ